MLDILEFNSRLYSALEKNRKKKVSGLGMEDFLAHSSDGIASEISEWLNEYSSAVRDENFGKKEAEPMLIHSAQLLRRGNAAKVSSELLSKLREARTVLSNIYEGRDEHLEHGGKWAHHDYIDIKNGRYIYAKDKKPNRKALQKLENLKKIEAKNTQYVVDKAHEATQAGANYRLAKQFDPEEKNASTQEQKKKAEETDKIYKDSFKIASLSNKSARDAIKKEAKESAEAKAKRQQIDAEIDARKRAANEAKGQAEAEAKAKWQEQKAKEEAANKQWEKGFYDSLAEYSNNAIKAAKTRINAATDPDDPWLVKQANMKGSDEISESARKRIKELEEERKKKQMQHSATEDISDGYKGLSEEEFRSLLGKTAN
ncbi:MAG: hypothetical protein J6Y02_02665 [Pseudobutyrivibrio sp.]|nr:hypothetical protein [Pseudobutyrivibrio sp.]